MKQTYQVDCICTVEQLMQNTCERPEVWICSFCLGFCLLNKDNRGGSEWCFLASYLCRVWGEVSSSPLSSPGRLAAGWLLVNGWELWLTFSHVILILRIQLEPRSVSLGEEPTVTLYFYPFLCCLQCLPLKIAALLPQTSPLGPYPGLRLNRESKEALVEMSEGCPSSEMATPQKPAFSFSLEIFPLPTCL